MPPSPSHEFFFKLGVPVSRTMCVCWNTVNITSYPTQTKCLLVVRLSSILVNGLHQTGVCSSLPLGGAAVNTRSYTCGSSRPPSLFSFGCSRRIWMASRIFLGNSSWSRSMILTESQLITCPESRWCSDRADDRDPDATDFLCSVRRVFNCRPDSPM